jgi:hypothetical protein
VQDFLVLSRFFETPKVQRHRKEFGAVDTSPIPARRISLQRSVASGLPKLDASTEVMPLWAVSDAERGLVGKPPCDKTGQEKRPDSSGDIEREKWITKQLLHKFFERFSAGVVHPM